MPPKQIILQRTWVTTKSTIGIFTTHDGSVTGFMLEPAGPSTSLPMQDRRIPAGTYNLIKNFGSKHPDCYRLYNQVVSMSRAILIHPGNKPNHTSSCLLPGISKRKDMVENSETKLKQLNKYIATYIDTDGVQIVIKEMDTMDAYTAARINGYTS